MLRPIQSVELLSADSASLSRALANSFYNRGNAHFWLGALENAERDYQSALEHDRTHYLAMSGLGDVRLRQTRYDDAKQAYSKALRIQPNDLRIRTRLDMAERGAGSPDTAPSDPER